MGTDVGLQLYPHEGRATAEALVLADTLHTACPLLESADISFLKNLVVMLPFLWHWHYLHTVVVCVGQPRDYGCTGQPHTAAPLSG